MGPELLESMIGERCWHVSAGGATAPSFVLAMGAKVPRESALANPTQPEEFRLNRGSVELLVWSSWRLQEGDSLIASSDQGEDGAMRLRSLAGQKIEAVRYVPPAWDLQIRFADGKELVTFSDHLERDSSIEANWEFWANDKHLVAGPGTQLAED